MAQCRLTFIAIVCVGLCQSQLIPLTEDEQQEIVKLHNGIRAKMGSVAMMRIVWNSTIAKLAETIASQCTGEHTGSESRQANDIGENIYQSSDKPKIQAAMDMWDGEAKYYNIGSNVCSAPSDDTCLHFTQLVWASTYSIGCALSECTNLDPFKYTFYCDYYPAGNAIDMNGNMQPPYKSGGDAGTECQKTFKIAAGGDGLCG